MTPLTIYLIYWLIFLQNINSLEKYILFILQFILNRILRVIFNRWLSYKIGIISKTKIDVAAQLVDALLITKFVICNTSE